jgi:site-specific recombinase XerD
MPPKHSTYRRHGLADERIWAVLACNACMCFGPLARLEGTGETEIDAHLKSRVLHHHDTPLIASQRHGRAFSNVSLSMLFKELYEAAGIRTSSHSGRRTFATRLNAKGMGMRTIQKLMGHRHIGTMALYCDVSEDTLRNAVELV